MCLRSIRKILKYLELNENETTACQNCWDVVKAALRREMHSIK